jgi:hypothetical protein
MHQPIYIHLLLSVVHPTYEMTITRYCISIDEADKRLSGLGFFDIDQWAMPENRKILRSLLCEDWLTPNCEVVNCEEISGAVQWGQMQ